MKKVLIILYYWPPGGGMAVQRWLKFAKYLPEYGWEPIVYAPENADYPETDHTLVAEAQKITVLKRTIFEPSRLYGKFLGLSKKEKLGVSMSLSAKPSRIKSLKNQLSMWIRANLFIPDAHVFWVRPSYRYLKKYLAAHPVDVIVTTGTPHSIHLIGRRLRKKFDIPWVADFRDLWTKIDYYADLPLTRTADRRHHRMEQRVLREADHVVTVGELWKQEFLNAGAREVTVITNGYDPEDMPSDPPVTDRKFTLVHVGSIGKNRNATALWKVLGEKTAIDKRFAADLELKLIGGADFSVLESIRAAGLAPNLNRIEYLDHREALRAQQNAGVLLLLINNSADARGRLTGKIFEYMAAKRPILAIGPEDGEAALLLEKTGAGRTAGYENPSAMARFIDPYYEDWKNNRLEGAKTDASVYSRKHLTGLLAGLLNRITESRQKQAAPRL